MIEHKIIKQKNYAYIAIKQSPDYNMFVKASLNFVTDPDFSPELGRLCDFSQADLSGITTKELIAYAEFSKAQIPMARSTRIALVTQSEDRLAIFKSFADSISSGNVKVFVDPTEASVWLTENTNEQPESFAG